MTRRTFLSRAAALTASYPLIHTAPSMPAPASFKISLAEWSLHRTLFSGELHPLDFPVVARKAFDIDAVEYVSAFFLRFGSFIQELKRRADGEGVTGLLVMVDDQGRLGDPNDALRQDAVGPSYLLA